MVSWESCPNAAPVACERVRIHGVTLSDCLFKGIDRGIRLKSRRGLGVARVADRNSLPIDSGTPSFRSISLSGIQASGVKPTAAFRLAGRVFAVIMRHA